MHDILEESSEGNVIGAFFAGARASLLFWAIFLIMSATAHAQVFVGDFESGKIDGAKWKKHIQGNGFIEIVTDPVRAGKYAMKFKEQKGGRTEIVPVTRWNLIGRLLGKVTRDPIGSERWYGFSTFLPADWLPCPHYDIVAQWHDSPDWYFGDPWKDPPLQLIVKGKNWIIESRWDPNFISGRYDRPPERVLWSGSYETGRWTDWVFHIKWSYKPNGFMEVWKNGRQIVRYDGSNCYNDLRGVYFKFGVYESGVERTIYHDELRIGDEEERYEKVSPQGNRPAAE